METYMLRIATTGRETMADVFTIESYIDEAGL